MYIPPLLRKQNSISTACKIARSLWVRLFYAIIICLSVSSCGNIPLITKTSELYHAGPAIRDYTPQEGIVEEIQSPSSVTGPTQRRIIVYLPKEYYSTSKNYPVLYLLHGARGYETSWIRFGEVYESTDSLWREGLAQKCIIVMPNVNQYDDDADYANARAKGAFESIFEVDGKVEWAFMQDVVKVIDSKYRTIQDRSGRAIAGLSIGGYQSIYFGANYPDMFGYVGAMSPYFWSMGQNHAYRKAFYGNFKSKLSRQFEENPPYGYYLYAGKTDIMRPSTAKYHRKMERKGYEHEYLKYPGTHDWPDGWIDEYKHLLQQLFKSIDD